MVQAMRETHAHEDELAFDLIDRLHKTLRVSHHNAESLAPLLGVSANTVRNYLRGKTRPTRGMLIAWAFAVDHGVTVEWLQTGLGVGPTPPNGRQAVSGPGGNVERLAAEKRARSGRRGPDTPKYAEPLAA